MRKNYFVNIFFHFPFNVVIIDSILIIVYSLYLLYFYKFVNAFQLLVSPSTSRLACAALFAILSIRALTALAAVYISSPSMT